MPQYYYLRPYRRRPVCVLPSLLGDVQAAVPRAWCESCGKEVFGDGFLCDKCRKSLDGLPANGGPRILQ